MKGKDEGRTSNLTLWSALSALHRTPNAMSVLHGAHLHFVNIVPLKHYLRDDWWVNPSDLFAFTYGPCVLTPRGVTQTTAERIGGVTQTLIVKPSGAAHCYMALSCRGQLWGVQHQRSLTCSWHDSFFVWGLFITFTSNTGLPDCYHGDKCVSS